MIEKQTVESFELTKVDEKLLEITRYEMLLDPLYEELNNESHDWPMLTNRIRAIEDDIIRCKMELDRLQHPDKFTSRREKRMSKMRKYILGKRGR
jgi:hypothetical protein